MQNNPSPWTWWRKEMPLPFGIVALSIVACCIAFKHKHGGIDLVLVIALPMSIIDLFVIIDIALRYHLYVRMNKIKSFKEWRLSKRSKKN